MVVYIQWQLHVLSPLRTSILDSKWKPLPGSFFWVSHSVLMTTGLSSFVLIKADRRLSSFKKENYWMRRDCTSMRGAVLVHNMPCYEALLCASTTINKVDSKASCNSKHLSSRNNILHIFISKAKRRKNDSRLIGGRTPRQMYDLH